MSRSSSARKGPACSASPRAAASTSTIPTARRSPRKITSSSTTARRAAKSMSEGARGPPPDLLVRQLVVDAAEQLPVAEKIARAHLPHVEPAVLDERLEREI